MKLRGCNGEQLERLSACDLCDMAARLDTVLTAKAPPDPRCCLNHQIFWALEHYPAACLERFLAMPRDEFRASIREGRMTLCPDHRHRAPRGRAL